MPEMEVSMCAITSFPAVAGVAVFSCFVARGRRLRWLLVPLRIDMWRSLSSGHIFLVSLIPVFLSLSTSSTPFNQSRTPSSQANAAGPGTPLLSPFSLPFSSYMSNQAPSTFSRARQQSVLSFFSELRPYPHPNSHTFPCSFLNHPPHPVYLLSKGLVTQTSFATCPFLFPAPGI